MDWAYAVISCVAFEPSEHSNGTWCACNHEKQSSPLNFSKELHQRMLHWPLEVQVKAPSHLWTPKKMCGMTCCENKMAGLYTKQFETVLESAPRMENLLKITDAKQLVDDYAGALEVSRCLLVLLALGSSLSNPA